MNFDVSGEPIHTRCLTVVLRVAEQGSIHFRGDLVDLRKSGLMELAGVYAAAGIIHKMEVQGEFSAATTAIERIEWAQSHVAHEANRATCGESCRDPLARLEGLVGASLGEDFGQQLTRHFGGALGCSHITTLLREISAVVSGLSEGASFFESKARRAPGERIASRSVFLDGSLPEGAAVAQFSVRISELELDGRDADGDEIFARLDEMRLVAAVDFEDRRLRSLRAGQRSRGAFDAEGATWQDRSGELADFVGQSLSGGMARRCLEHFGTRADAVLLRSALLNLSPAFTQVAAALTDTPKRMRASGGAESFPQGGPCYMLRADGPLVQRLISDPSLESENS